MKRIILFIVLLLSTGLQASIKVDEINYQAVYDEILENQIVYPDIAFAQSVLESGHYTSKVFTLNNNLFGMRLPRVRETVAIGSKMGYAVYDNWTQSIKDYSLYQQYIFRKDTMSKTQYFKFLDKKYAGTKNYSKKLKDIIKKFQGVLSDEKSEEQFDL